MGDMNIEYTWVCEDVGAEYLQKTTGSDNDPFKIYSVTRVRGNKPHQWECSCPAWVNNRTRPCKHIQKVAAGLCDWGREAYIGNFVQDKPKSGRCPKCGGPLTVLRVAV